MLCVFFFWHYMCLMKEYLPSYRPSSSHPHTNSYLICSLQWVDVRNCSSTHQNNEKLFVLSFICLVFPSLIWCTRAVAQKLLKTICRNNFTKTNAHTYTYIKLLNMVHFVRAYILHLNVEITLFVMLCGFSTTSKSASRI